MAEEVTVSEMKQWERLADENGLSYLQMMENAGIAAADFIRKEWPDAHSAALFCGKGNNGGDGFVVARILHQAGLRVLVILAEGEPVTDDATKNRRRLTEKGIPVRPLDTLDEEERDWIRSADILVDALYGTGFHGELRLSGLQATELIASGRGKVLALDVPSGVEADTGRTASGAVRADATVTFHARKPCHRLADSWCGKVWVADIGIDKAVRPDTEENRE